MSSRVHINRLFFYQSFDQNNFYFRTDVDRTDTLAGCSCKSKSRGQGVSVLTVLAGSLEARTKHLSTYVHAWIVYRRSLISKAADGSCLYSIAGVITSNWHVAAEV